VLTKDYSKKNRKILMKQESKQEDKNNLNFLGIMFNCCGVYGRIYKNKEGTAYVGRCPKCMRRITIKVGEGGTSQRFFNAY
jgi:hypothetical protein